MHVFCRRHRDLWWAREVRGQPSPDDGHDKANDDDDAPADEAKNIETDDDHNNEQERPSGCKATGDAKRQTH